MTTAIATWPKPTCYWLKEHYPRRISTLWPSTWLATPTSPRRTGTIGEGRRPGPGGGAAARAVQTEGDGIGSRLSQAMGHSSVETTQVYAKVVDLIRENPTKYLEELMGTKDRTVTKTMRLLVLRELWLSGELHGLALAQIARPWGVHRSTILRDLRQLQRVYPEELERVREDLQEERRRARH